MKKLNSLSPKLLAPAGIVLMLALPQGALAACDIGAMAAAQVVKLAQEAAVKAMTTAIKEAETAGVDAAKEYLLERLEWMDKSIIGKLDWWWNQLGNNKDDSGNYDGDSMPALQTMIQEMHGGVIDQSRQRESDQDGNNVNAATRQEQRQEMEAKKTYQPTNQTCQFDTIAGYLGRSSSVSRALTTGYSLDFNKVGQGDKDSPAAGGPQTLQKARWDSYKTKFCDPDSNGGNAGCTTPGALANMDVLPSKTIFAKETIDMTDADTREAVNQLLFNITGYDTPEIISQTALKSPIGLQQRQKNREYLAQMDAVGALAYSIVAERAPGKPAPEIQEMRQKMGVVDASPTPSAREIRQAIIEQLWDPGYYVELGDSPSTLTQKELYLKAYSLVMLYDMISKQEKISTAYAIETANMLEKLGGGRNGAGSSAPVK